MFICGSIFTSLIWPLKLEYMSGWSAAGVFALLAVPILWLGVRSLSGLGPVRKWVAIGARLAVLALFVLILAGARWQRENKIAEVMLVRDISESTQHVRSYPGDSLQSSLDRFVEESIQRDRDKKREDRIGQVSFSSYAQIDAVPNTSLRLDTRAIREQGAGTDVASAIQLALAALSKDAMHRLVLFWDGNATDGDIETAIAAAASQKVPIDVVPLRYDIQNEVLLESFVAPTWKRENEPFTIDVILRSTNVMPVTGKLTVMLGESPLDMDPYAPGVQPTRQVELKPGLNAERVRVPALESVGVHQFRAIFESDNVVTDVQPSTGADAVARRQGDTILDNNTATAFTFVRGKGKVLYIENVKDPEGSRRPELAAILGRALMEEGITLDLERTGVDQFPTSLIELQNYDAVVLANVRRGADGLSEEQQAMLAAYVHDMGGGLLMIGGEDAFGAGGWQGSRVEEILPVNMDIPAQRQIPKGALVLVMHSCEMPQGNYYAMECAIKAADALSSRDEIGIISYGWGGRGGPGIGGAQWDFPLQEKADGTRFMSAVKNMQLGDMPDFNDTLDLALNGAPGAPGLLQSDARQKHVIIISDGDPTMPSDQILSAYQKNQVTISTITVYTHTPGTPSPQMIAMAKATRGRAYGPIEDNPNQLPQIFIKEATVVRRSLIHEDRKGIPLSLQPSSSEMVKGISFPGSITGMVLTSRKPNPQVDVPIVAGKNQDPVLASWQTGLGRAAVFTSDAHNRWLGSWAGDSNYQKFWAQVVRSVARPPMSADFDVQTVQVGDKGRITVEAMNKDDAFINFLNITGAVIGPDNEPLNIRLVQTGPGTYSGEFDAKEPGNYVVALSYGDVESGQSGRLVSGMAVNSSPEMRDLRSNDMMIRRIAEATGGRVLEPFDVANAALFTRQGLQRTASPLPIWDILLPILLLLILLDVAIRRIAWDWQATRRAVAAGVEHVRTFVSTRKVESRGALDALQAIRQQRAGAEGDGNGEPVRAAKPTVASAGEPVARPDPRAKFEAAEAVEGDITNVVGGATDKPVPPPPKKVEPKGAPAGIGSHTGSLLEAKRRARQQIQQKEKES